MATICTADAKGFVYARPAVCLSTHGGGRARGALGQKKRDKKREGERKKGRRCEKRVNPER